MRVFQCFRHLTQHIWHQPLSQTCHLLICDPSTAMWSGGRAPSLKSMYRTCGPHCKQIPIQQQLVLYEYELMSRSEWKSTATLENNGCCLQPVSHPVSVTDQKKKENYCYIIAKMTVAFATKNSVIYIILYYPYETAECLSWTYTAMTCGHILLADAGKVLFRSIMQEVKQLPKHWEIYNLQT